MISRGASVAGMISRGASVAEMISRGASAAVISMLKFKKNIQIFMINRQALLEHYIHEHLILS